MKKFKEGQKVSVIDMMGNLIPAVFVKYMTIHGELKAGVKLSDGVYYISPSRLQKGGK